MKKPATRTPIQQAAWSFLRISSNGRNGRDTMRVSELKRFLGIRADVIGAGATRPPNPTGLCTELREAEIPLSQLGQLLLDPTTFAEAAE